MASPSKVSTCNSCDRTFTHSTFFPTATRSGELLQILRTNCAPRDSSEIRAIISAIPAELARYTMEIDRLDDIFQELYAASEALQQLYDQCMAIADSPIRRLPTELLGEIFSHCVEPEPASSSEPSPAGSWEYEAEKELRSVAGGNLVPLSQVCARWRGVIIGTPTLWSTIKLDLRCWTLPVDTMRASLLHQQMIHLLHVALERGQQAPLTVEVIGVGECHPAALQALALASCRWRSATFVLNPAMLQNLSAAAGNLPLLEGLSINADEDGETLIDVVKYFSHAPKLRGVGFVGSLAGVGHLPLAQLQYCTVWSQDLPNLLVVMEQLASAEELYARIDFQAVRAMLPLELTSVVSPILEFNIESGYDEGDDSFHALAAIFGTLTLPNMEQLKLVGMLNSDQPLYWPQLAACALFARSASRYTLKYLCLQHVVITESELLDCLAELPSLLYLFISDHPSLDAVEGTPPHLLITDSLLKRLTPHREAPTECLVPNLETLDLRTLARFTENILLELIIGRINSPNLPFECAVYWFPGHPRLIDLETTLNLDAWVEAGQVAFICRDFDPDSDQ